MPSFITGMSDRVKQEFTSLEAELGVPIRVIKGSGRYLPQDHGNTIVWSDAQIRGIRDNGYATDQTRGWDDDFIQANGLTIVSWGLPAPMNAEPHDMYPAFVRAELEGLRSNGDALTVQDFPMPMPVHDTEEAYPAETSYSTTDRHSGAQRRWAFITERTAWYAFPFETLGRINAFNYDLLFSPVRAAAGGLDPEFVTRRNERSLDALMELARDTISDRVRDIQQRITSHEQDAGVYRNHVSNTNTQLRSLQTELTAILGLTEQDDVERIRRQWESMTSHPLLSDVVLSGGTYTFTTVPLQIHEPLFDRVATLGVMKTTVRLGRDCHFSVVNLTNPRGGRAHPHIPNGSPCFGDMSDTMFQYARSYDIGPLTDLLLVAYQTCNVRDDWGRYAAYWFEGVEHRDEIVAAATVPIIDAPQPTTLDAAALDDLLTENTTQQGATA